MVNIKQIKNTIEVSNNTGTQITAFKLVNVYNNSGTLEMRIANSDYSSGNTYPATHILLETADDGESKNCTNFMDLDGISGISGLTKGPLYLGANGNISANAPTISDTYDLKQLIGFATDSTKLLINIVSAEQEIPIENVDAGVYTSPSISLGTNSITLGNGVYTLFSSSDGSPPLIMYTLSGGTFTSIPDEIFYLIVDYNGGNPLVSKIIDRSVINQTTIIPILTCYNLSGTILYIDWDQQSKALANKMCDRLVRTDRFRAESGGFIISETSSPIVRTVTMTGGYIWHGAVRTNYKDLNSSLSGEEIAFWYHVSGIWTRTTVTQYNNSQYDDGTDLQSLLPNRYCVNWIYRGLSNQNNRMVIVLGTGNYTLAEAQASTPPSSLPTLTANIGILIGRIIVENGYDVSEEIDSALTIGTSLSQVTSHNALSDLQGGTLDEYYHLSYDDYAILSSVRTISNITTNYNIQNTDYILICNASDIILTLPSAIGLLGKVYHIKKIDTSGVYVRLTPYGSETIDGNSSLDIIVQYANITLVSDNSNWHII